MSGVLHTENVLDLGAVIITVIDHLRGDDLAPEGRQTECLFTDPFDHTDVQIVLRNHKTQVDKVTEALADARLIKVSHGDPSLRFLQPV